MPNTDWHAMMFIIPTCWIICITLAVIQYLTFRWYQTEYNINQNKNKRELFCIYGVYIIGTVCTTFCFLCHISNFLSDEFCVYGLAICVILYSATKSFLYGFFLERVRCIRKSFLCTIMPYLLDYILPVYIIIYFAIFVILCPLEFRGRYGDPFSDNSIPTACTFYDFAQWVMIFAATADAFNCVLFLWLFVYPLYIMVKTIQSIGPSTSETKNDTSEIIQTLKYNIIFSSICTISSVSLLVFASSAANDNSNGHYIALGGGVDIMINAVSTFFMIGANRKYIKEHVGKCLKINKPQMEIEMQTSSVVNDKQ
eukprot:206394_1